MTAALEKMREAITADWVSVHDLMAITGWKSKHSVRGAASALKRSGLAVERKREAGVISYGIKPDDHQPRDDFSKSVDTAYEAVKERVAAGGPNWSPKA